VHHHIRIVAWRLSAGTTSPLYLSLQSRREICFGKSQDVLNVIICTEAVVH
jgi:hypothetical protein